MRVVKMRDIRFFLPDQAALHGVLAKIRDLNLKLISVSRRTDGRRLETGDEPPEEP